MRPRVPVRGDLRAGGDGCGELGGGAVGVAGQGGEGGVLDGVVGVPLALDAGGFAGRVVVRDKAGMDVRFMTGRPGGEGALGTM